MINLTSYMIFFSNQAFAAGNSADGSVSDLIAPFINVLILVGFLVWKLRVPVNNFFAQKATQLEETLAEAERRAVEAEKKYREEKAKLDSIPAQIAEAKQEGSVEVTKFKSEQETELNQKLESLTEDKNAKINAQASEAATVLEELLINEVISKAKQQISSDKSLEENVNKRLLEGAN